MVWTRHSATCQAHGRVFYFQAHHMEAVRTKEGPVVSLGDHIILLLNDDQYIFTQVKEKGLHAQ